jgi:hypothetical protein
VELARKGNDLSGRPPDCGYLDNVSVSRTACALGLVAAALGGGFGAITAACSTPPLAADHDEVDAGPDAPPASKPPDTPLEAAIVVACTSITDCPSSQVCCGPSMMTAICQVGPCPPNGLGTEPCRTSSDCFIDGWVCATNAQLKMLLDVSFQTCEPPVDDSGTEGGTPEGGSTEGGTDSGLSSDGESGTSDAPADG